MNIKFATSTIEDGNMSFVLGATEEVIANREQFLAQYQLSIKDTAVLYNQQGDGVVEVDNCFKGRGIYALENALKYDAIITQERGLVLFLLTADCIPGVFYDLEKGVVALVHLGWRGVNLELGPKVINILIEKYGCDVNNIQVNLGPSIQKKSYYYEDVTAMVNPGWQKFLTQQKDLWQIDNIGFACDQLYAVGIKPENIQISPVDTATDTSYFSHYRSTKNGDPEGRIATFAVLV